MGLDWDAAATLDGNLSSSLVSFMDLEGLSSRDLLLKVQKLICSSIPGGAHETWFWPVLPKILVRDEVGRLACVTPPPSPASGGVHHPFLLHWQWW